MIPALQIVIPGGTGQLGRILAAHFSNRGGRLTIFTRRPDRSMTADGPGALLKSRRVLPGRLLGHGFQFEFPEWPSAARDLVLECNGESAAAKSREGAREALEESHEQTN
jgi:NAD dependent epimerase/dehydratase family enzyme